MSLELHGIHVPAGSSGEVHTTCPQCSASRKKSKARCLSVNVAEQVWHCHHCGWSGTAKDKPFKRREFSKPPERTDLGVHETARNWFASRCISEATMTRNGVTSGKVFMPQVDGVTGVVIFPYRRKGALVNRKYRDREKNFRMDTGCERVWFGMDDAQETCFIVEGEMDKLALEEAEILNCVSVPDGAPAVTAKNYESKFDFIANCESDMAHVKTWIIAVDSDEPGRKLEEELARRLGRDKCLRIRWPRDCKDANDVLCNHGAETLKRLCESTEPFPIHGVFSVLDQSDKITTLFDRGLERGVSTGWTSMDPFYTVRPGEFTVVTGIPNSGKSNFLDDLAVHLAKVNGWGFGICSPENQPLEDHMARFIEKWSGQPFGDGPTQRMSRETLDAGIHWANEHFHFILPKEEMTLDTVLNAASQLVKHKGIKGLILDPWNEFEHKCPNGQTETQYISETLTRLRHWARKHAVHLWVVVHPAKLVRDKSGNYPVPTLYDCHGSAHWRNKADNGLSIWRDFTVEGSQVEIHIQKIRFRQIGKLGMCPLKYNRVVGTYSAVGAMTPVPPRQYRDDSEPYEVQM